MASGGKSAKKLGSVTLVGEDSSESEAETEPARSFHRRLSTNREIKCSVGSHESKQKTRLFFVSPQREIAQNLYHFAGDVIFAADNRPRLILKRFPDVLIFLIYA